MLVLSRHQANITGSVSEVEPWAHATDGLLG